MEAIEDEYLFLDRASITLLCLARDITDLCEQSLELNVPAPGRH